MATQVIGLEDPVNDDMLDALVDALDGAGAGDIQIVNSVASLLVTIPLSFPAFADAAAVAGPPKGSRALWTGGNQEGTAATAGAGDQIATAFNARDDTPTVIFTGSVGALASGEAMELSNTTLNNNDTVRITEIGSSMFMPDNV